MMSILQPIRVIPPVVYLLALSMFAMGSAEFLMGGILPMIAADLDISLPTVGTLIAAFAVGALIGGPPFAILTRKWSARATLFLSQLAFVMATVLSLLTQHYWLMMGARFGMGLAYACFWAVAAATAVRLSSPEHRARAISIVLSGLSAAMILGGPLGTLISDLTGWRGGFWAVAAATALAAVAGWRAMPANLSADEELPSLRTELRAMKRPMLWLTYATTAVTTAAYMGTFSYVGALLIEVSGLTAASVPGVLTLFGIGAFIGLIIGGKNADRHPFVTLTTGIIGLILVSAAIGLFAAHGTVMSGLVFALGFAGFLLNPAVWSRVYQIAPDAPLLAGATNSSAFQAGLTMAPLLGGVPLILGYGLPAVAWVGSVLAFIALGLTALDRRLSRRRVL